MTTEADARRLGIAYYNAAWELAERPGRTPEEDRLMLATAMASLLHWQEAGGTETNLAVGEWQVAHMAARAGFTDVAQAFAVAAYERARAAELPTWLQASTAEGRARAAAAAGDRASYEQFAAETATLLTRIDDEEDRRLIESQLTSISFP